jgi:hypothetical protein
VAGGETSAFLTKNYFLFVFLRRDFAKLDELDLID